MWGAWNLLKRPSLFSVHETLYLINISSKWTKCVIHCKQISYQVAQPDSKCYLWVYDFIIRTTTYPVLFDLLMSCSLSFDSNDSLLALASKFKIYAFRWRRLVESIVSTYEDTMSAVSMPELPLCKFNIKLSNLSNVFLNYVFRMMLV